MSSNSWGEISGPYSLISVTWLVVGSSTAVEVRERLHAVSTEALLEGRPQPEEVTGLRADLTRHEAAMPALEEQEQHLKRLHFEARRDHLKQLRQERPGQWLVLE